MKLAIHHDTTYRYADRVRASIQYLRLTPQDSARQRVLDWQLELPQAAQAMRDAHGNILHVLTLDEPHQAVVIGAHGHVEIDESCESESEAGSPLPYLRSTALTAADAALREF
ncbi:MAG TPA: transglutaminase N-terminal domain-containing protein, partial [Pseudomonas sp.]